MPRHYSDLVFVPLKYIKLFHSPDIVDFKRGVSRASQKPISIYWIKPYLIDCVIVGLKSLNFFAWLRIPQLYIIILTPSYNQWVNWMPVTSFDIRPMSFEANFLSACYKIVDFSCSIVWAREKLQRTCWETQISNASLIMSLKLVFLTDLIIWVHNIADLVPTYQVFLIISPAHSLYSIFMNWVCLLIFEIRCIPNDYIPTRCTCNNSFPALHPFNREKRVSLFMFLLC